MLNAPTAIPSTEGQRALLGHKLSAPVLRHGAVAREALCERMSSAPGARLVLVCAPAGFGKTTAMAQCRERLDEQGVLTAWLTLDARDNDLARLLAGLEAAIDRIAPESAGTGARTGSTGAASVPGVGAWALALTERLSAVEGTFALFLDDADAVHHTGVLSLLSDLIARLPRGGQLFMGSRSQPALPLARLRARGQLVDVDTAHLRFSRSETAQCLDRLPERLSPAALGRLHERTEGWAAALWLASMALEQRVGPHRERFIEDFTGSHRGIADYLAEEVLAGLPADLKDFLLRTSILKQLEPGLCQALLPEADAPHQLSRLAAANVFLAPVDGEPGSYRYHALFASFLRAQLVREAPAAAARMHRTAAQWYAAQSRPVPAIDHALEAGDTATAVELLSRHAMPLLMQGRLQLLSRWFADLPPDVLRQHPLLQAARLWAQCLTAGPGDGMAQLDYCGIADSADPAVRAHAGALRVTLLAMMDRHAEAYAVGQPLVAMLPSGEPFADTAMLNVMADTAAVMGRHAEARALIDAARRADGGGKNAFSRMYSESVDGIIDLVEGRQRQAAARFRLAASTATAGPRTSNGGNAWAGLLQAAAHYEANELELAERLLHVYVPLACDAGLPDHTILGHVMQSRIAMARRDPAQAMQRMAELESLGYLRQLPRVVASARLERARMAMHQGDTRSADAELQRAEDPALWQRIAAQSHLANDLESLPLSRLRREVLVGDAAAVRPAIDRAIATASTTARWRRVLLLQLLGAMAALRCNDVAAALLQAQAVMTACARAGFFRLVLDEGPLAGALLQRLSLQNRHPPVCDPVLVDHLQRLVLAFDLPADPVPTPPAESLTRQELRVLDCVAEGLSNDALAGRLEVSTSTVRTHLRSISSKLGAHNRTQAVAIARRIGVLA